MIQIVEILRDAFRERLRAVAKLREAVLLLGCKRLGTEQFVIILGRVWLEVPHLIALILLASFQR